MGTKNKLVQIQNELKAPKSNYNSFGKYNYRSCEDILEALKPILLKHDCQLTLSDEVETSGEFSYISATATITSNGEFLANVKAQAGLQHIKKGMDIAQIFGASSSYARKYALSGLFLLDDSKDADTMKPTDQDHEVIQKLKSEDPSAELVKKIKEGLESIKTPTELNVFYKTVEKEVKGCPALVNLFKLKKAML